MQSIPPTATLRRPRRRRLTAILFAVGLVAVLAACEPTLTTTPAHQNAADAAAEWIAADYETHGAGYAPGQLADTALSLAALGQQRSVAEAAVSALEQVTPGYIEPGGHLNVGATAKVMLAVQATHGDVNDYAGVDLEALLRGAMVTSGADAGRLGNANGLSQALGILTLMRTPGRAPIETGEWLIAQQCPDGGFSSGSCMFESPDATGLAMTALAGSRDFDGRVDALVDAYGYLDENQLPDGGWGASSTDEVSNTNSTGLAAHAIRVWSPEKAEQGAAFIESLQYRTDAGDKAGAIPWLADNDGAMQMSTTQAVLAFGSTTYQKVVFAEVVGEACEDEDGVTVVVDFALFDGTIRQGCAEGPQDSGWAAVEAAGFTIDSVPGFEGGAVCTIDDQPVAGYPDCWLNGFWSYWHSTGNDGVWDFSDRGASDRVPPQGSVEGWRYEPDLANHIAAAPGIAAPVR